jgi:Zn-dependent M28 family amino/carboxypeptidase
VNYTQGTDFGVTPQSDPGDVTAAVTPVDIQLGLGNSSSSGCEAADFAGFPAGNIALLQRGTCTFELKAENAAAAGAVGVIFFNQGNTTAEDRNNIPNVTLTAGNTSGIPALSTPYALGATLAGTPGLVARVHANVFRGSTTTQNLIAELGGGNTHRVVMAGAHLDSVQAGPGINDNGSGSSALLEVAENMAKLKNKTPNKVRFAWWGAEEDGLVGSTYYVDSLTPAQQDDIELYLNFDMIAPASVRPAHPGPTTSRRSSRSSSSTAACPRSRRHSQDAPTTSGSSRPGSPPAGCSREPRLPRPRTRSRSGVARQAWHSTPATTRPATRSPTSATRRWTSTPTPWPQRSSATP